MKLLALLSVFFLISSPAFSGEAENAALKQLDAMMTCDPTGHLNARFMSAFTVASLGAGLGDDKIKQKKVESLFAKALANKTCVEHEQSYREFVNVIKEMSGEDFDAYLKTGEGKTELDQMAKIAVDASKVSKPSKN